jgi:hypothetical protein
MQTKALFDQVEAIAPRSLAELQCERLRWSVAQAGQSAHYAQTERSLAQTRCAPSMTSAPVRKQD